MKEKQLKLKKILVGSLVFLTVASFIFPDQVSAQTASDKYVRVANVYLKFPPKESYNRLAKYDLVVLPVEIAVWQNDIFPYLREKNPDIILLAYIPTKSVIINWNDPIHQELKRNIRENWKLKDNSGKQLSVWPGTYALNANSGWSEYLPKFVDKKVFDSNLWDGVFYDEVSGSISWLNNNNLDLDGDRRQDSKNYNDNLWKSGMVKIFKKSRELAGPDKVIVTNGSSTPEFQKYLNGRMFEKFPTPWEGHGKWTDSMSSYQKLEDQVGYNSVFIINGTTNNTGNNQDYSKVRFGLTSALMGNGYFSFDYGDQDHGQLWWYDEFDAYLGLPKNEAYNIENEEDKIINNKAVWRRDFENGLALVNSSLDIKRIGLDGEYEKLHGYQDPAYNDGSIVERVTIPSEDGIILLRPIERIKGSTFTNGSFARVFNQNGQVVRNGFFAYDNRFRGSSHIIIQDLDDDGKEEILVADDSKVDIYNYQGTRLNSFYPYGPNYNQGINITVGDLNNDGNKEIVTGTEKGGGPQIRIFNNKGKLINPGFFAYGENFRGGVQVAIGDLNGDGWKEIIAGAGYGGGPHIRVFGIDGRVINPGFFAYDPGFRGGVNVAVGDLNGDNMAEIIAGSGFGGGPQVRIFNEKGQLLSSGFFAFNSNSRGGVKVIASDLNKDGRDEIIATSTNVFTLTGF